MKKITLMMLALIGCAASIMAQKTAYGLTFGDSPKLVSFSTDDPTTTTALGTIAADPRSGAAVENNLYFYGMNEDFDALFYSADLTTGTAKQIRKVGGITVPADLSYDNAGEKMYYIATDLNHDSRSVFGTVNLQTGATTQIKDNIVYSKALAINATGEAFLLGNDGALYTLDKNSGATAKVGDSGMPAFNSFWNFQSMDFDRATGDLFVAAWLTGDKCELYRLSTSTGAATRVDAIGSGKGVHTVALAIPYVPSEEAAPKKVTDLTATADATGALKAAISWTNPTQDNLDNELTAIAKAEVLRGEEIIATLTDQQPGAQATYTDTPAAAGMYRYTVRVYNGTLPSADQFADVWVGHDLPAAVTAAKADLNPEALQQNVLTWSAPTTGKNGGYIDTQSLRYDIIRVNDNKTVATNLSQTSYTDTDLFAALTRYTYEIVAKNADGTSEKAQTNALVNGPSQTIPFTADYSTWDDGAQYWTINDGNNDGYTFSFYKDYMNMFGQGENKGYYVYQTSESMYGYDFIISPPLLFTEGHDYMITATVSNDDIAGYREESFRFYTTNGYTLTGAVPLGDESFTVKHPGEFKSYGYLFRVKDDGMGAADETFTSFIALCCDSHYDEGMLLVSKITITDVTQATGINDIDQTPTTPNAPVYNMLGQRVSPDSKGLLIINGKKVVRK